MITTPETTSGFVQVDTGIQLFYIIQGNLNSPKPIIVLSSSLAANIHLWDDFVADFEPKYTILRYDARFHGQSPPSTDPNFDYSAGHTMEQLTDDVLKLLNHLKIQRVRALVGLSIGAAVALIFGAKYPERVDQLVVVGTRATSNSKSNANHAIRIKFGYRHGPLALGRQSISRWFDEKWRIKNPGALAHAEEVYGKQSIQGYEASIAALRSLNLFPYAKDVGLRGDGARFVLVAGELDGTVPKASQELGGIMGSEVAIIHGSGHITPIQMPSMFHEVVRSIIEP